MQAGRDLQRSQRGPRRTGQTNHMFGIPDGSQSNGYVKRGRKPGKKTGFTKDPAVIARRDQALSRMAAAKGESPNVKVGMADAERDTRCIADILAMLDEFPINRMPQRLRKPAIACRSLRPRQATGSSQSQSRGSPIGTPPIGLRNPDQLTPIGRSRRCRQYRHATFLLCWRRDNPTWLQHGLGLTCDFARTRRAFPNGPVRGFR